MKRKVIVGIHKRAEKFLEKYCKMVTTTVTTVRHYHRLNISFEFSSIKDEIEEADISSKFHHHFENENIKLKAYVLADGRIVHEKLQPYNTLLSVVFTALAWEDGKFITETLWTEEEMSFAINYKSKSNSDQNNKKIESVH